MQSTQTPDIAANVRVTNEGQIAYEYQYAWCVVSDIGNPCGGGDDIAFSSAAKLIHPGEDFDTVLHAAVPAVGTYYFKVVVYYGAENSRATQQFVATSQSSGSSGGSGGGGGGGGGGPAPAAQAASVSLPLTGSQSCRGADFNGDKKVNTIDFSILLAFWKKQPPFKNACVDINRDRKVDARDFSIFLSQWGTVGSIVPGL
jgi:hypothetical protein